MSNTIESKHNSRGILRRVLRITWMVVYALMAELIAGALVGLRFSSLWLGIAAAEVSRG